MFTIRRSFSVVASALCLLAGAAASADPQSNVDAHHRHVRDVVLVHGAWADGSSWSRVIEGLQRDGFHVVAVQLPERSLAEDAAIVRDAIDAIPRPVVVAGHSYGGLVMSEATAGASNVAALVFVAAFAPDTGEALATVGEKYPVPLAITHLVVDAHGNATIDPDGYVRYFAADVRHDEAAVLAATQHPISAAILGTPAGVPGWRTIPSFYQVSTDDQVIDPNLERFFAQRMGAETIELRASHVSLISHAHDITSLIERAAR